MFLPKPGLIVGNRYSLTQAIGRGGMGEVWKAHDRELDTPCAVKFILQHLATDRGIRDRFAREAKAVARLRRLPGARLFQYRTDQGDIRRVGARDVNTFLREVAGEPISIKDFRTLIASSHALAALAQVEPAEGERQRRKQVLAAVRPVAETLANTAAICRRSYVHAGVIKAFEDGTLARMAQAGQLGTRGRCEQALGTIIARAMEKA